MIIDLAQDPVDGVWYDPLSPHPIRFFDSWRIIPFHVRVGWGVGLYNKVSNIHITGVS